MTIEFDDNGKFYTDIIAKNPTPVWVQTANHLIHGDIHIRPEDRLKDELDQPAPFIAITDAIVYAPDGQTLFQTHFMAVRRGEVIWVIPESEITDAAKKGEK